MLHTRRVSVLSAIAFVTLVAACGGDEQPMAQGPEVVHDSIGDTLVVRTVSGSVWGAEARLVPEVSIGELDGDLEYLFGSPRSLESDPQGRIYVVDGQVPDLRVFDTDGRYLATYGRPGEGPGELKGPDGGLAILSDGRILVRDPGNGRIQIYTSDGTPTDTWPLRGGFNTSTPFFKDRQDNVYVSVLVDPRADVRDWVMGLARISPTGEPGDTLVPPDANYEAPSLEARTENSVSRNSVPFSATEEWVLHPDGYFVHGVTNDYRFTLYNPAGPLRVERVVEAPPVAGGEKSEAEAQITRNMRSTQEGWRWNGPPIPDRKPAYRDLYVGRDGRIWVLASVPGVHGEDPDYDPSDPDAVPDEWSEPVVFDVFEDDGTYLGRVAAPDGFRRYPTPIFDGDQVWATTEDDLGVIRVARFRIEHGSTTDD